MSRIYAAFLVAGALALAGCSNDNGNGEAAADDTPVEESAPEASAPDGPDENAAASEPVDVAQSGAPQPDGLEAAAEGSELEAVAEIRPLSDWYFAVVINEEAVADPADLEPIGREICEGLAPCRAAMWYNPAIAPRAFPVDEDALLAQVFAVGRTIDGRENVLWNCDVFPQFEAERRCLPRLLQ